MPIMSCLLTQTFLRLHSLFLAADFLQRALVEPRSAAEILDEVTESEEQKAYCISEANDGIKSRPDWGRVIREGITKSGKQISPDFFIYFYHMRYRHIIEVCMCRWRLEVG